MRLLPDTHLLLWALAEPARLPAAARDVLEDLSNDVTFSPVSIWEVGIKAARRRADFGADAIAVHRTLLAKGYAEIEVNSLHAIEAAALPPLHHDPFDRMLVAQAQLEDLVLVTADKSFARYGVQVGSAED